MDPWPLIVTAKMIMFDYVQIVNLACGRGGGKEKLYNL